MYNGIIGGGHNMNDNNQKESIGIYLEDAKDVRIESNHFNGLDKAISGKNIENIEIIDNIILNHNPKTPNEIATYLIKNKEFVENLEKANKGDKVAKEYFQSVLSSTTSTIVTTGINLLLNKYGIKL